LKRLTSLTGVLAIALLSACTQNDRPDTSSKNAPKAAPQAYSRNPFPSTYRAYPGHGDCDHRRHRLRRRRDGGSRTARWFLPTASVRAVGGADTAIPKGATRIDGAGKVGDAGIIDVTATSATIPRHRSKRTRTATRSPGPVRPRFGPSTASGRRIRGFTRAPCQWRRHLAPRPARLGEPVRRPRRHA
jgi:hypothetical protein